MLRACVSHLHFRCTSNTSPTSATPAAWSRRCCNLHMVFDILALWDPEGAKLINPEPLATWLLRVANATSNTVIVTLFSTLFRLDLQIKKPWLLRAADAVTSFFRRFFPLESQKGFKVPPLTTLQHYAPDLGTTYCSGSRKRGHFFSIPPNHYSCTDASGTKLHGTLVG